MSEEDEDGNACVVCFKNTEFYSVGQCDHPVCYECSTRMRVLCQQTECPICRQDMPKVIFMEEVRPFQSLREQLWERRYKIGFATTKVEAAYRRLLQHSCKICQNRPDFKSFNALKDHMRREHELFFCDLCVENLKIFSFERRCYKRHELGQHRRKGDSDDRSHRGHPLCEFCDERFMDNDELFRHLRRNHLFCHFCDADGYHRYFGSYEYLREHFRTDHYLCEEGDCKEEKLTSVFRSDIDLKAHRASVHGKALGKAATKQARTLELEFTLAPRPRPNTATSRRPFATDDSEGAVGFTIPAAAAAPVAAAAAATPNTRCTADFPSLTANGPAPAGGGGGRSVQYRGNTNFRMTEENFPALRGGLPVANQTVNISLQRGAGTSNTANNLSIKVKHRRPEPAPPPGPPRRGLADFPALGTSQSASCAAGASSWKGTVAPRTSEHAKPLPERFSSSCSVSGSMNGVSAISVQPPAPTKPPATTKSRTPAPVPTKVTVAPPEADENKSGGSKSKKKKNKNTRANSSSPSPAAQAVASSSAPPLPPGFAPPPSEERKCSELKIGSLKEEQRAPSLPPAMGPPPGFSAPLSSASLPSPVASPPPGFSVTLNSVARPVNGLTFTNSCGQSFPIRQTPGIFQRPANFEQRNAALVQGVKQALQKSKNSGGLEKFRQLSSQFRGNLIEASDFYNQCKEAIGLETFSELFPELLALLPDIRKQQELWRAHGRQGSLEECRTCGQVVRCADAASHLSNHMMDSHFPALSGQASATSTRK